MNVLTTLINLISNSEIRFDEFEAILQECKDELGE